MVVTGALAYAVVRMHEESKLPANGAKQSSNGNGEGKHSDLDENLEKVPQNNLSDPSKV